MKRLWILPMFLSLVRDTWLSRAYADSPDFIFWDGTNRPFKSILKFLRKILNFARGQKSLGKHLRKFLLMSSRVCKEILLWPSGVDCLIKKLNKESDIIKRCQIEKYYFRESNPQANRILETTLAP